MKASKSNRKVRGECTPACPWCHLSSAKEANLSEKICFSDFSTTLENYFLIDVFYLCYAFRIEGHGKWRYFKKLVVPVRVAHNI